MAGTDSCELAPCRSLMRFTPPCRSCGWKNSWLAEYDRGPRDLIMGYSAADGDEARELARASFFDRGQKNLPLAYKVGVPPKKKLLSEFTERVKETLFADDPLYAYKNQPRSAQFLLGIQSVFPILSWGRDYSLKKFKGDLIAGFTIASLCIPQDIGYSKLANLDPQYGLYSSFVSLLVYAAMGSSRDIAIGPIAVVSLLLGTLLQNEFDPITEKEEYLRLAFTATFFAGVTQAVLGLLRLGFLIDFLSNAAIVGLMAGTAITIGLQQLKGFLGIQNFTKESDIIVMKSVWGSVNHGGKKRRSLFWVLAIALMISVILSTLFVYITRIDKHGVQIVNKKMCFYEADYGRSSDRGHGRSFDRGHGRSSDHGQGRSSDGVEERHPVRERESRSICGRKRWNSGARAASRSLRVFTESGR
ncbi:Sulfate transporter 1.2 [Platanthera zijinensis]|uniref:Sulfate transporter 1.2 n=1 Tax=Platanthera zijinensis TaxID=2320716 RepID=A0AAP0G659_9ASPA